MKTKAIPSGWIQFPDWRLDCGPYMSGALEARMIVTDLKVRKDRLREVTLGGMEGMYHVGMEKLKWVRDRK